MTLGYLIVVGGQCFALRQWSVESVRMDVSMDCDRLPWGQGLGIRVRMGSQVPEPSVYVGPLPGRKHARRMVAGVRHRGLSFWAAGSASQSQVVSLGVLWGTGRSQPYVWRGGYKFCGGFYSCSRSSALSSGSVNSSRMRLGICVSWSQIPGGCSGKCGGGKTTLEGCVSTLQSRVECQRLKPRLSACCYDRIFHNS